MKTFTRLLAGAVLAIGMTAAAPAMAQHHWHGGGWHGGGWHGGGGHWHGGGGHWRGGGWGGPRIVFGFGAPYYAPYAYGGNCGWVRTRYWRHGYLHVRRVWRCW